MELSPQKQFRSRFVACQDFISEVAGSTCVLPISIGQHYVEGARFESMIDLVNSTFSCCDIIVIDLLQRHTLRLQYPEGSDKHHWHTAITNGKQWLERNMPSIKRLDIPYRIRYWHEWLYTEEYLRQFQLLEHLYYTNQVIQQAFDSSVHQFTQRYLKRYPAMNDQQSRVFDLCMDYVKEECSIMPLWVKERYAFEVYPGKRLPGMQAIYDLLVKPSHPNCLRWLQVNMRSIKKPVTDG